MIKQIIILTAALASLAHAAMVVPNAYMVSNADGETFEVSQMGDEHLTYLKSTKDGTILFFDKNTNNYTRAIYSPITNTLTYSNTNYTEVQLNPGLSQNPPPQPTKDDLKSIYQESRDRVLSWN